MLRRPGRELRFKLGDNKEVFYLVFERMLEVSYDPANVVAVDVNKDSVTVTIYESARLIYLERIETDLSRITIAYPEKSKRIIKGHH